MTRGRFRSQAKVSISRLTLSVLLWLFVVSSPLVHGDDVSQGKWTVTDSMYTARHLHTSTLLADGDVLVTGGIGLRSSPRPWPGPNMRGYDELQYKQSISPADAQAGTSAEIYNHKTGSWTVTNPMSASRFNHTATLLPDGDVLVVAGQCYGQFSASADLYNVATHNWTQTGALHTPRNGHSATLMPDGRVLVVGGGNDSGALTEFYTSSMRTWDAGPSLHIQHALHVAELLPDGKVMVAAGCYTFGLPIAAQTITEVDDPKAQPAPTPELAPAPAPTPEPVATFSPPPAPDRLTPPPPPHFVTFAGSLLVVTVCIVIITACVVVLLAVWLAFVLIERFRK